MSDLDKYKRIAEYISPKLLSAEVETNYFNHQQEKAKESLINCTQLMELSRQQTLELEQLKQSKMALESLCEHYQISNTSTERFMLYTIGRLMKQVLKTGETPDMPKLLVDIIEEKMSN